MANEVYLRHTATGATLYFTIRNTARQMWNTGGTPNFETLTVANWTSYDVALSESPASSYFYHGTFPAVSGNMVVGFYFVEIFLQAGGTPAIGDSLVASYFGYWDGTTYDFNAINLQHWLGVTPLALSSQRLQVSVAHMQQNVITADALATDFGNELAALIETFIVNEGDATAVMQAIADKIAQDWVAGDASPLAIAAAVWQYTTRILTANTNLSILTAQEVRNAMKLAGTGGAPAVGSIDYNIAYPDGFVYYHPDGASGQVVGVNGTLNNPCSLDSDMRAVGISLGRRRFRYLKGYAFTGTNNELGFAAPIDISECLLDLNSNYVYMGATVNGISGEITAYNVTTGYTHFLNGTIYTARPSNGDIYENIGFYYASSIETPMHVSGAIPPKFKYCGLPRKIQFQTNFSTSQWASWYYCYSYALAETVELDFNAKLVRLRLAPWTGNLVFKGMTHASTVVLLHGYGKLTINNDCTAGIIQVTSHMEVFAQDGSAWVNGSGKPAVEIVSMKEAGTLTQDAYDAIADAVGIELDPEFDQIDTANAAIISSLSSLSTIVSNGFTTMVTGFTNTATLIGQIPAAVWNVLTSTLTTLGSIGKWILDNAGGGSGLTQQQTRDAMKLAPTAGAPDEGSIDELLLSIESGMGGNGDGAFEVNVTVEDDNNIPITDCDVILTTVNTSPSIGTYANGETNGSGVVTFYVDEGTYYVWRQKGGINFDDNPLTMNVDADGNVTMG